MPKALFSVIPRKRLTSGHIAVELVDSVLDELIRFLAVVLVVGINLCDDLVALLADKNLMDGMAALRKLILKLLGGYVLTVVGDDEVLLTADEEQEAVLIDSAVVARLEPAVIECLGGSLGILVVASHDVGAADIYLADAVLIGIVYLYLVARKRSADAAGLMIFHGVGGNSGRTLGYAVAVKNLYTEVIETLLILGVKRSAADDDELKSSAELLMNLSEQLAADVDAELEKEAAYPDALLEDFLSAGLSRGLPDALIDSLDNQRNAGEILRMMGLEIPDEVLYIHADIAVGDDDERGKDSRNP